MERRGDRRPLFGAVVLAQRSLDTVDDGFGDFTEIGVAVAALVLETGARDVLEFVGHGSVLPVSMRHTVGHGRFASAYESNSTLSPTFNDPGSTTSRSSAITPSNSFTMRRRTPSLFLPPRRDRPPRSRRRAFASVPP